VSNFLDDLGVRPSSQSLDRQSTTTSRSDKTGTIDDEKISNVSFAIQLNNEWDRRNRSYALECCSESESPPNLSRRPASGGIQFKTLCLSLWCQGFLAAESV